MPTITEDSRCYRGGTAHQGAPESEASARIVHLHVGERAERAFTSASSRSSATSTFPMVAVLAPTPRESDPHLMEHAIDVAAAGRGPST
jgi:hypothetical protein